jgi:hypothetical protein
MGRDVRYGGFIGIRGYKKWCLVKIGVLFIAKMYWEGGSTEGLWEGFINI